ncbi:type 4 pilus major pilin [Pseudoxanthomonas sp. USHLN014]|uniref:type 4 pilus major pilin n=1 Tax=Pseudoxanthomonas sp. USHLN014 TaxID=3081297 RepID=UPI00301C804D
MTHTIRPRCSPTLTRLSKGVRSALGFTLTEALLALGVVTAATGAMFLFFGQVDAKAKVASETRNLRELSRRIESSFGMVGTFRGVSTTAIVVDGLAPDSQLGAGESVLTNVWGGAVNVQPYTVDRFGDSFSVSYAGLPRQACVDLVAANAGGVWDAQVSDVSVIRNIGGQLDVGLLGSTCADKSRVVFVYHSGLLGGEWTGAPLVLPPATPSVTPPVSPPVGTPVGPVGPVAPSTPVSPPTVPPPSVPPTTPPPVTPPAPPVSVTPPAPPTSPPATPPPISTTTPCQEWSENRTINCPLGQVGQVFQNRRHHCGPDPNVYEAWAGSTNAGSWTTTSSTCTPCPAPESRNVGCPAGQFGAIGQQRTFSCTGTGSWNAWTQTNTTCVACPAPFPQAETQWVTTAAACPAGQSGSHTWQAEQRRTRMGSYNCPATTWSLPSPTFTSWTAWADTGGRRDETNTCAPVGQACLTESNSGTLDASDAYYSISYSLAGSWGGCSASRRDNGVRGSGDCSAGANGVLTQSEWAAQAQLGDAYTESGSQSGWGSGMREFWGWDEHRWEKRASCTSAGSFEVLSDRGSGNSQPHGCRGELHEDAAPAEARAFCSGQPVGRWTDISYCSDSASHTYYGSLTIRWV